MLLIAASLFFTSPAPLDMPRAEAYLSSDSQSRWLEDRFDRQELWTSQTVIGRWLDDEGRVFMLSQLTNEPPLLVKSTVTRMDFLAALSPLKLKDERNFRRALAELSPVEPALEPEHPHQRPRGYEELDYWQGTNANVIVATWRMERDEVRYLATWEFLEGDDPMALREAFEEKFLVREFPEFLSKHPQLAARPTNERAALRADARHSVAAYDDWRVTEAKEFSVLDDIPARGDFICTLTNDLTRMRQRYSEVMPSPLDGSNVLCVARIYASREEYLAVTDTNLAWTAAYWCPARRELVAYLPQDGEQQLLKTIRHEAFHQYFSYAASMLMPAPWINEGYAEYFEDEEVSDFGLEIDFERAAEMLPGVLFMDYDEFYAGSDIERRLKYRLAWSIARFLEKGADQVRFRPFAKVKRDYLEALLKTRDRTEATLQVFGDKDFLKLFVREWKKYCLSM